MSVLFVENRKAHSNDAHEYGRRENHQDVLIDYWKVVVVAVFGCFTRAYLEDVYRYYRRSQNRWLLPDPLLLSCVRHPGWPMLVAVIWTTN